jgi:D-alanyl-D-alanine carboxypeptidase
LLDMILSKQYQSSYNDLLQTKILKPMGLNNTFYPLPNYSPQILSRLARGYSYNIYDNPELLGIDVTENNLSWAGAAGALLATSDDVLDWVQALFVHHKLLSPAQQKQMQQMISLNDGKPLRQTNKRNPRGFALGIAQLYDEGLGQFWFYEGKTLGYRALYMYVPCNQVIVVALFNSATNEDNDHSGALLKSLYQQIIKQNRGLNCNSSKENFDYAALVSIYAKKIM